jgi:hypothetical protein
MRCPICSTEPAEVEPWGPLMRVQCPRCGDFSLAHSVYDDLPEHFQRDALRAALIILWIGDNQQSSAMVATAPELALDAWIGARLPQVAGNASGLRWLVDAMEPVPTSPSLFIHRYEHGRATFQLTLAGWTKYADLKRVQNESRTAFMAMKFGDTELNDDHQQAGLIDDQIRAALISARFVVADLTHGSFGAYWEAGFADGRGLPVIYTCKRAEWEKAKTHFDTNHMTTVLWNPGDPGDLKSSEDQMAAIIRATLRADAKQSDG